jgi:hypothetical protein
VPRLAKARRRNRADACTAAGGDGLFLIGDKAQLSVFKARKSFRVRAFSRPFAKLTTCLVSARPIQVVI